MTAPAGRHTGPQRRLTTGHRIRQAILSLLPVHAVRVPSRQPAALPAAPPQVIVIKADPARYGMVKGVKVPGCPWDTAAFPAITDEVIREIESAARRGTQPVPGVFERVRAGLPGQRRAAA